MRDPTALAATLVLLLAAGSASTAGSGWQTLYGAPASDRSASPAIEGKLFPAREHALHERHAQLEVRWKALGGTVLSLSTQKAGRLGQLDRGALDSADLRQIAASFHLALDDLAEFIGRASDVEFSILSVEEYDYGEQQKPGYWVRFTQKVGPWPYRDSEVFLDEAGNILSLHLGYLDTLTLHPPPDQWLSVGKAADEARLGAMSYLGTNVELEHVTLREMKLGHGDGAAQPIYYFQYRQLAIKVDAITGDSVVVELSRRHGN